MLSADGKQHEDKSRKGLSQRPQLSILSKLNVDTFFQVKLTRNCSSWFN